MCRFIFTILTTALVFNNLVHAADRSLEEMRSRALTFLEARQNKDGSWTHKTAVGITGLVTTAMLHSGRDSSDPTVAAGIQHLLSHVRKDGGIYGPGSLHRNYETCIAIMAFSAANTDGSFSQTIENARAFLAGLQWDEGEGIESSDPAWGGAGYGSHQRPDMCNSEFYVEALTAAGVSKDSPEMQRVLQFISRCQNLESEHNTTEFAGLINDGGFYYTVAAGGDSKAGVEANGGLRSYGSMTYAGVKSLIYAGLKPDDPRILAATQWIRKNYTLDQNPGMGNQGLFYYYHTFAKTMNAFGEAEFTDAKGQLHNWREELLQRLSRTQDANGSWVNPDAPRWEEGDPHLVTAYCLLALSHCESSPSGKLHKSRVTTP
jgi:squalene-hopene/tetraprenyl-beta-curcumene cyclase